MSEKNYDPQMHTVEHLLNGAISKMLSIPRAFSTHIERKKSKIDFHFDRELLPEEVQRVQEEVNSAIKEGIAVTEEFLTYQQASESYDLSRIPEEDRDGEIRIVKIGDLDHCPCIGPHLSNTSECALSLKIISSDFNAERGVLRVRFKLV